MTTSGFVENILDEYDRAKGHGRNTLEREASRDFIVSDISKTDIKGPLTRKLAALILHRSLQRLTNEPDSDWGFARNFKDIYDCRVCANAVAQVAVKGIVEPVSGDVFGMTGNLSEKEAENAVLRLFDASKRVTNLLGFQINGNR